MRIAKWGKLKFRGFNFQMAKTARVIFSLFHLFQFYTRFNTPLPPGHLRFNFFSNWEIVVCHMVKPLKLEFEAISRDEIFQVDSKPSIWTFLHESRYLKAPSSGYILRRWETRVKETQSLDAGNFFYTRSSKSGQIDLHLNMVISIVKYDLCYFSFSKSKEYFYCFNFHLFGNILAFYIAPLPSHPQKR